VNQNAPLASSRIAERVGNRSWLTFVALIIGGFVGFGIATFWWSGTVSALREHVNTLKENVGRGQIHIVEVQKGPSYRVQAEDDVVHVNSTEDAPVTIYLPSGLARGKAVTIKDKKGNAFFVPIKVVSDAGKIDGLPSVVVNTNRGWLSFIWDGKDWSIN
jgi:hypothetical protein